MNEIKGDFNDIFFTIMLNGKKGKSRTVSLRETIDDSGAVGEKYSCNQGESVIKCHRGCLVI